jgi:hypothetical protein
MRALVATVLTLALAAAVLAAPTVFIEPAALTVDTLDPFEMSIRVDAGTDTLTGFLVEFEFDPGVIELVAAIEGSLFADCGCATLFGWDVFGPGVHACHDVTLGAASYVLCPGELVRLRFLGTGPGTTALSLSAVDLRDMQRLPILPVFTEGAVVTFDPGTGVEEGALGGISIGPGQPNPFRDGTSIGYALPSALAGGVAEVFDISGRLVRRLAVPAGRTSGALYWDGRSETGAALASSVYVLRLSSEGRTAQTTLVKIR